MSRSHALLSASASERWLHCTPSARLEDTFEDRQTVYTEEGTLAHSLAELKATKRFTKGIGPKTYKAAAEELKKSERWNDEMDAYTDAYMDLLNKIYMDYSSKPYIAIEKALDFSAYAPEGFGTADCIMIGDETLTVIDFKYGKGVTVDAKENTQMQLYALGAYEAYKILYSIKNARLIIAQPRTENISIWEVPMDDILSWGERIKPIAQKAFKGEGEQITGEWCKWCKARVTCRAKCEENIRLAGFVKDEPRLIPNSEIGKYIELGEDISTWVKALKEYALSESLEGREIKGWKAVEGVKKRKWINQAEAFKVLVNRHYTKEELLYERLPLSVPKVEKLIGKKAYQEIEGELVIKSAAAPTLVKEDDRRPAITNQIKAEDIFKEEK